MAENDDLVAPTLESPADPPAEAPAEKAVPVTPEPETEAEPAPAPEPEPEATSESEAEPLAEPEPEKALEGEDESLDPAFIRLVPLTLDLMAERLTRLDLNFTRHDDRIVGGWKDFTLTVRTDDAMLFMKAVPKAWRGARSHALAIAICDEWNTSQFFLKASSDLDLAPDPDHEDNKVVVTSWVLTLEVPFTAGIAPVQLSNLIVQTLRNIDIFIDFAATRSW